MNPEVDHFIASKKQWNEEYHALRAILLKSGLTETIKWRVPCYTHQNKNIVIMHGFKEYFALSFFKGSLLKDPYHVLATPGENSQASRMFKFSHKDDVIENEPIILEYIEEAIGIESSGKKISYKQIDEYEIPQELKIQFQDNPSFEKAFNSLSPGRQRAYLMFFGSAKQSKTVLDRIEKFTPRILHGFGMNDCVCGHTKKKPGCDGSHKLHGGKNM